MPCDSLPPKFPTGNAGVYGGGIYNDATATAYGSRIYGNLPDNCVDVAGRFG